MRNSFSPPPLAGVRLLRRCRLHVILSAFLLRDTFPLTDRSRLDIFPRRAPGFFLAALGGPTVKRDYKFGFAFRVFPNSHTHTVRMADTGCAMQKVIHNSQQPNRQPVPRAKQLVVSTSYFVSHYVNVWSTRFICFIFRTECSLAEPQRQVESAFAPSSPSVSFAVLFPSLFLSLSFSLF